MFLSRPKQYQTKVYVPQLLFQFYLFSFCEMTQIPMLLNYFDCTSHSSFIGTKIGYFSCLFAGQNPDRFKTQKGKFLITMSQAIC